jgi:hypothetical protein
VTTLTRNKLACIVTLTSELMHCEAAVEPARDERGERLIRLE